MLNSRYEYKGKDYNYLKDTYVEISRNDNECNERKTAKVIEVKADCLRVVVEENGEEFWTDVDSVWHE